MWQCWMEWKMSLCNWHTFWMAPSLICFFIVVFFYIERKWLLLRSLATVLPLKSKFSPKFQRFNNLDRFSIKMKNCKTLHEVQTASHLKEIFLPPANPPLTRWNLTTSLEQKFYYGDIQNYTGIYFPNVSRMRFLGVKKWCSANVISYAK